MSKRHRIKINELNPNMSKRNKSLKGYMRRQRLFERINRYYGKDGIWINDLYWLDPYLDKKLNDSFK